MFIITAHAYNLETFLKHNYINFFFHVSNKCCLNIIKYVIFIYFVLYNVVGENVWFKVTKY